MTAIEEEVREMTTSHRLPAMACPHCGHRINEVTPMMADRGCRPPPGAFSVCIACANLVRFNSDMTLRKADFFEALAIHPELFDRLKAIRNGVLKLKGQHPGWPGNQ